nr:hypothetical protein Iba_chr02aCG11690 [Ipomoea batatas]
MEDNCEMNCEPNFYAANEYGVQGANPEASVPQNCHKEIEEFLPECDDTKKPYIGQRFDTIDDGSPVCRGSFSLAGGLPDFCLPERRRSCSEDDDDEALRLRNAAMLVSRGGETASAKVGWVPGSPLLLPFPQATASSRCPRRDLASLAAGDDAIKDVDDVERCRSLLGQSRRGG